MHYGGHEPFSVHLAPRLHPAAPATYTPTEFLRVRVPTNWGQVAMPDGVTYAPEGGVFQTEGGQPAFTHGVQIGVAQGGSGNLQRDTQQLLQTFARTNPGLRDGSVLYLIGVAPQPEAGRYERAFQQVRQSLQIADR